MHVNFESGILDEKEVPMSFNMNLRGSTGGGGMPSQTGNIIPKGQKYGQINQYTPQQNELFSSLFGHVGPDSYISKLAGGSEEAFAPMEQRAQRDFQESIGGLASRFSGMGSGARRSSAFQNQATQGAQDFASLLQDKRRGYQSQALQELMSMSQLLLGQHPYEQFVSPEQQKQPSFLKQLALGLAGGASQGASSLGTMYGAKRLGVF